MARLLACTERMSLAREEFDVVVAGGGWRGLAAALRVRRAQPEARLLVVEAAAQPGGSVRTQRTNGFLCELGPFAFTEAEIAGLAGLLERPPAPIPCLPGARNGWLFTGLGLEPLAVDPLPWSYRTGCEDLIQACRRELGGALRLGRPVTTIDRAEQFLVTLGGEVPGELLARELVVALPEPAAGRALGRFDPALAAVADRMTQTAGARVFFAGQQGDAPAATGYGIVPDATVGSALRELIFCSEVFPGRALAGRFLWRAELGALPPTATDEDCLRLAETEVRRWTNCAASLGLHKVHHFAEPTHDGALVECRIRLRDLPQRVPGLSIA